MTKPFLSLVVTLAASVAEPVIAERAGPMTVWNQAYQETYEADAIEDILAGAEDSYVLLDPFDAETDQDWPAVVAALQANGNEVAAYISIGTGENWRGDFATLRSSLVARQWDDWGGEYFIDTPGGTVRAVMQTRIDTIAAYGFEWVEFDNMDWTQDDGHRTEYGFSATVADGTTYYQDLCRYAQSNGLKCMAKSTVENAGMFDGATYESYPEGLNWWDEDGARSFLAAGKPVIVIHYDEPDCDAALAHYTGIYGETLSFLCETEAANGYVRPRR